MFHVEHSSPGLPHWELRPFRPATIRRRAGSCGTDPATSVGRPVPKSAASCPSAARWRVDGKVRPAMAQTSWTDLAAVHQVLRFIVPNDRRAQSTDATGSETTFLLGPLFELFGPLLFELFGPCAAYPRTLRQGRLAGTWPDGFGSATACAASHFALPEESGECTGTGEHHGDNRRAHRPDSIPGRYSRIGSNAEVPVSGALGPARATGRAGMDSPGTVPPSHREAG